MIMTETSGITSNPETEKVYRNLVYISKVATQMLKGKMNLSVC